MSTATLQPDARQTEPMDRFDAYVDGVLSGDIVACDLVIKACRRHVRDLERSERGEVAFSFDREKADETIRCVELLPMCKGRDFAGKPLHLEGWECFIVGSLFGWVDNEGMRRFRVGFVEIARKNGKSTLAAAIGVLLFLFDGETGAEVYSSATKRDQAKIVHTIAKQMVIKTPALRQIVTVLRDNMSCEMTGSKYEPLGADADTTDGLDISGAIVDEVHAHKSRDLWDVLETGTGARRQPLLFAITTAGRDDGGESICWEHHQHTVNVLEEIYEDDSWFGMIFTLDEGDAWNDESNWPKANPNLGVSVSLEDLRRKCKKAEKNPGAQVTFRQKHTDLWVTSNRGWLADPLSLIIWNENGGPILAPEAYRGRECAIGGDLSSVHDLTSLVAAFPGEDGVMDIVSKCWCPRENALGRSRDRRVPYLTWSEAGLLDLTEGRSVDYDAVREFLRTARDEWGWVIKRIAFDPHNARYLITKLVEDDGFNASIVVEHLQTAGHMEEPISETERLLLDRKIRHGNDEVLRWCASNAQVYLDSGGRRRFDKKKTGEKIDAAVAMVMGVWHALEAKARGKSYYEDHYFEVS